jgi:hypothetical protein
MFLSLFVSELKFCQVGDKLSVNFFNLIKKE